MIADLGLEGVDISISPRHAQLDPAAVLEDPSGQAANVSRLVRAAGLLVADVFVLTGFGPSVLSVNARTANERQQARRQFDALLQFAVQAGAPGMTVLPGEPWNDDPETGLAVAAEELAWRAQQASAEGLGLSFEPHAISNVRTPDSVLALLDRSAGVGLTLDYSHFVSLGITEEAVDPLLPHARHFQARQASPGHLQATARTGVINFPRIIHALIAHGYVGWFGIEYTWNSWMDEVDTIAQTALLRDVARTVLS
ncbi:MAG: sugar phosphate isomerase/epimerase [Dehalococcoidia bacterium]|nr:sugar phosphate isomerase/epimerase [Dehalococcoidia bacterium]